MINATVTQGRASSLLRWVKTYKVACGVTEDNLAILSEGGKDKVAMEIVELCREFIGCYMGS